MQIDHPPSDLDLLKSPQPLCSLGRFVSAVIVVIVDVLGRLFASLLIAFAEDIWTQRSSHTQGYK
jgi:hypothetical protein